MKHYQNEIMFGNEFWIDETFVKKKPADAVNDQNGKHIKNFPKSNMCHYCN